MLNDHEAVVERLSSIREDYSDTFIRLGDKDTSTQAKKEISSLTGVLYEHLPIVRAIVDEHAANPVYVGYDGRQPDTRSGTYTKNLILMHENADDDVHDFIHAYTHELMHLDQDYRGLLREDDLPNAAEEFVGFLMHNLALEAAAYATEAITMHYISCHSDILDIDPSVAMLIAQYLGLPGRDLVPYYISSQLPTDKETIEFDDYKDAWRELFMSFFAPDSEHLQNYIESFGHDFIQRAKTVAKNEEQSGTTAGERLLTRAFNTDRPWGNTTDLKAIATIPHFGEMFSADAIEPIRHMIESAIIQKKFDAPINLVRNFTKDIIGDVGAAKRSLEGLLGGDVEFTPG